MWLSDKNFRGSRPSLCTRRGLGTRSRFDDGVPGARRRRRRMAARRLGLPAERHPHPGSGERTPASIRVRLMPLPEGRGSAGRRGTRSRCAGPLRRADAEPAGVRLAGHVDPARRSGLCRRADPAGEGETGVESLVGRRPVGRGGRLRGVRGALSPHVGRPGDQVDHVHRPDRDDLRRPRHPRRLEHLGCVATPDVSRFRSSWRGMAPLSATKSRQSRQNSLPSRSWRPMCPACSGGCGS